MKQTYVISRAEDDPGPGTLIAQGAGRSLKMTRGCSHEVKLDPENENDAMFLRGMSERYSVKLKQQAQEESAPKPQRRRMRNEGTEQEAEA